MATTAPLTLVQQSPGERRRQAVAQSMMGNALQYRPMRTGWEALGQLASAYAGAKIGGAADEAYQGRRAGATETLAEALANRQNPPAPYGTPDEAFYGTLATNPDTADLASQMQLNQVIGQQNALSRPPNLTKVYDPNSPTGTSLVDIMTGRTHGYGPPGSQGLKIGFDGGELSGISFGGTGISPAGEISKPTTASVTAAQKDVWNQGKGLSRLSRVKELYRPEFQEIPTRFEMWGSELKDRFGALDPADKKQLSDFSTYRKSATNHLNMLFNEISGAAVSPDEAVRLKGGLPNPGTGIWDGDSPTVFESALNEGIKSSQDAISRYNLWMKVGDAGGNPWDLGDITTPAGRAAFYGKRQEYAEGIERELAPEYDGMDNALLINAVRTRLKSEGVLF